MSNEMIMGDFETENKIKKKIGFRIVLQCMLDCIHISQMCDYWIPYGIAGIITKQWMADTCEGKPWLEYERCKIRFAKEHESRLLFKSGTAPPLYYNGFLHKSQWLHTDFECYLIAKSWHVMDMLSRILGNLTHFFFFFFCLARGCFFIKKKK